MEILREHVIEFCVSVQILSMFSLRNQVTENFIEL